MGRTQGVAPYYAANANVFADTTWVATVVGTATAPLTTIQVWYSGDQMLEWGYTAGTGNTHVGYIPIGPLSFSIDFYDSPLVGTVYIRKKAGGSTPGSGILLINATATG